MDEIQKINIYVPNSVGAILKNDALLFEVLKKDRRTINRNKFLSMLLLGYYDSYSEMCHVAYEKIYRDLSAANLEDDLKDLLSNRILDNVVLPNVPPRKGKNPTAFSLKATKETEGLILKILDDIGASEYISQYFCKMLISYCDHPLYKRERIVFRDTFGFLEDACRHRKPIAFSTTWKPKQLHYAIPYKIVVGDEGMFNYLLCAEEDALTGKQEARTYRLCRINRPSFSMKRSTLDDHVKSNLDRMASLAPQFAINDDKESCVKLSRKGVVNFNRIYFGRPKPYRIEEKSDGCLYYFNCSEDQVFLYFRRFEGDAAEVIAPQRLRDRMELSFFKNYNVYMGESNEDI